MRALIDAAGAAPFIFVAGKGGTGKTTAAGALALALADTGPTHLLSTDPAHSTGDLFGQPLGGGPAPSACTPALVLEELDAQRIATEWLGRARGPVAEILEHGTWLDADDVAGFTRLALPGLDEMMAVLRLVELAGGEARVVVDTAPTGHTLRLLDAAATHEGLARALRAMSAKAAAVASAFARAPLRLTGESIIDELEAHVHTFREHVLGRAVFILATRPDPMVLAETRRLADQLERRRLRTVATISAGAEATAGAGTCFSVPLLPDVRGCDGLRQWLRCLTRCDEATAAATVAVPAAPRRRGAASATPDEKEAGRAAQWLSRLEQRLLVFAGKGGVGKTTCAAAVAVLLSESRDVLLCSADPAGSLDDVFACDATGAGRVGPRLRVLQVQPEAELQRIRSEAQDELLGALERIGLSADAALDRRVIETLLELVPPGVDELAGLAALLDAAASGETIVLDTAPTGHFLRLLAMPELALDWVRQLMRILVKYRAAGAAGGAAEALLRTSRELRALQELLHDDARTGVFVVSLDEPLVTAETDRLLHALDHAGVPVLASIVNRSPAPAADTVAGGVAGGGAAARVVRAPELGEPPTARTGLRAFVESWSMPG